MITLFIIIIGGPSIHLLFNSLKSFCHLPTKAISGANLPSVTSYCKKNIAKHHYFQYIMNARHILIMYNASIQCCGGDKTISGLNSILIYKSPYTRIRIYSFPCDLWDNYTLQWRALLQFQAPVEFCFTLLILFSSTIFKLLFFQKYRHYFFVEPNNPPGICPVQTQFSRVLGTEVSYIMATQQCLLDLRRRVLPIFPTFFSRIQTGEFTESSSSWEAGWC